VSIYIDNDNMDSIIELKYKLGVNILEVGQMIEVNIIDINHLIALWKTIPCGSINKTVFNQETDTRGHFNKEIL
jgi:hypothetical protein